MISRVAFRCCCGVEKEREETGKGKLEGEGRRRGATSIAKGGNISTYHGGCARTSSPVAARPPRHPGPWPRRGRSVASAFREKGKETEKGKLEGDGRRREATTYNETGGNRRGRQVGVRWCVVCCFYEHHECISNKYYPQYDRKGTMKGYHRVSICTSRSSHEEQRRTEFRRLTPIRAL